MKEVTKTFIDDFKLKKKWFAHTNIIPRCIRVIYVSKLEPAARLMCIVSQRSEECGHHEVNIVDQCSETTHLL